MTQASSFASYVEVMSPEPVPHRVRAWRGADLVVDTTTARRVDDPGRAPILLVAGDGPDGLVPLDHDALRVEVDDGGDPKRFPTWGDAADLCGLLDVRDAGGGRFVSGVRDNWARPVVEGSQILGQAVVAAIRHAQGRRPVSTWLAFTRVATTREPIELDLDEVVAGRTFTTLSLRAGQGPRVCAAGSMLLDVTAPDVVRHAVDPPDVPGPDDCPPVDMSVTGRDVRIVDGAYTGDPDAPVGPPQLDAWVRFDVHEVGRQRGREPAGGIGAERAPRGREAHRCTSSRVTGRAARRPARPGPRSRAPWHPP